MTTRSTRLVTKCMIHFLGRPPIERCSENQILFVDVRLVSMRHNPVAICYLPYPFVGELHYLNESRVIPKVVSDIILFIYPLHKFVYVDKYMLHAVRPGQRHYVAQEHLQRSCCRYTQS